MKSELLCPNCGIEPTLVREEREVPLGARRISIEDEWTRCGKCGEEYYTREQAARRHRLAVERARLEDGLLSPSEIRVIRESLGLTQREFESVLGVGEKTAVRWETGRVCQNKATDRLIRLVAAKRDNLPILAGINGVSLPDQEPAASHDTPRYPKFAALRAGRRLTVSGTSEDQSASDEGDHGAVQGAVHEVPKHRVASSARY